MVEKKQRETELNRVRSFDLFGSQIHLYIEYLCFLFYFYRLFEFCREIDLQQERACPTSIQSEMASQGEMQHVFTVFGSLGSRKPVVKRCSTASSQSSPGSILSCFFIESAATTARIKETYYLEYL